MLRGVDGWQDTEVGKYYLQWRMNRAISMASCFRIYGRLNVKLKVNDCKGETFFAGIPPITQEEINAVYELEERLKTSLTVDEESLKNPIICYEKIGNDGKYHKVDKFGFFIDDF